MNALKGFENLEQYRQRENDLRMRLQTTILFNIQVSKDYRIKDPRELIKFPWEDDGTENQMKLPPEKEAALIAAMDADAKNR